MLSQFSYSEQSRNGTSWKLEELELGGFNLVVGSNASGKTRVISALSRLAALINDQPIDGSAAERTWNCAVEGEPITTITSTAGQSFSAGLQSWAGSVITHTFSRPGRLGSEYFARGVSSQGDLFEAEVKAQMEALGFPLQKVLLQEHSLAVAEKGGSLIGEKEMSQALIRSLSAIILLCHLKHNAEPACWLMDDLAEGLDYKRSSRLATLTLELSRRKGLQIICTTNDRQVMNKTPLKLWSILKHEGDVTRVLNYKNSKAQFDEFKFTGLTNFDFFAMDFVEPSEEPGA